MSISVNTPQRIILYFIYFSLVLITVSFSHAQNLDVIHDASTPITRPGPEFGVELKAEQLKTGPTMDVAVDGEYAFAIGRSELRILEHGSAAKPFVIGRLNGLGNTRQIAVSRGYAYITAREDGLFIVDVREPAKPKLVHHYDTAELATAIAVSGDVAAIGNRCAGVELLDVSNPSEPKYLSTIRVGEAQSLVFHGSWLYTGLWSEKGVAVIDVSNPWRPLHINTVPLDGKGDGLDINGNLLAAATGHHSRSLGSVKPGDSSFGHGHGIEFFDISEPARPRKISGLKFPPFYRLGMDMWGVSLSDTHALVNDTHNGFFLIDVREPTSPRHVGWYQLPLAGNDPSPAAGVAFSGRDIFVAGAFDDLHMLTAASDFSQAKKVADELRVPAELMEPSKHGLPAYVVDGSVRSAAPWKDDFVVVAAGSAGWHIVRLTEDAFEAIAKYPTRGFARDVAVHEDKVFVAESLGGLSIWQSQPGGMQKLSTYQTPGKSIHQVTLADKGRIAFLAVGANALHAISVEADGQTTEVMQPVTNAGLFYREPFSPLSVDGKSLLVQWHVNGLQEFFVEDGKIRSGNWVYQGAMDTECGAAPFEQGWIATSRRGLFLLSNNTLHKPEDVDFLQTDGRAFPGKPSTSDSRLFIADPFLGHVSAFDLKDPENPRLIERLEISGHPGRVVFHQGKAFVPAGRDGLLMWAP